MSKLYKLVACSLTLLVIALLAPVQQASAHCTAYHPHHCVEDVWDSAADTINPPAPSPDQLYEFTLINNSSQTVYVAYGKHRPYSSSTGGLMFITTAAWTANGWWSVAPGSRKNIYSSYSDEHIYFRFENGSGTIVPRSYEDSASFCTSSYAFYSIEQDQQVTGGHNNFEMNANNDNSYGATCASVGGEWETFYKMRAHMNFTVN